MFDLWTLDGVDLVSYREKLLLYTAEDTINRRVMNSKLLYNVPKFLQIHIGNSYLLSRSLVTTNKIASV